MDNISREAAIEIMAGVADAAAIWFNKDRPTPIQDKLAVEVMAQFAEFCAEQLEALSALPAVDGWLPIESAPRGQEILVSDGEDVCTATGDNYSTGGHYIWEGSTDRGGLKELEITPTHWMPLPAPPIE